ncbi:acyl carrier protein [Streptomyces yatensis]|uniref:Phosphopantetheine-binding protein n=1 Tax=Streptomyces yatensis TaxID=155177 RepID=A0ABP4V949_9ACTN|nr:phosphopantetheine-binding protein [Streptomyces yatensis]
MTTEATTPKALSIDEDTVLAQIAATLRELPDAGLEDAEISRETLFHDDLELESIDLVTLAGLLREHYGERVNLALFIADLELDEIIALTVGQLADYVTASLRATEES